MLPQCVSQVDICSARSGDREVVAFQGDIGFLNLITEGTPPVTQQVRANELPVTITTYALTGVQYITWVLLSITGLALLYIVVSRGGFEPWNVLELNRVAGMV
ncbi:Aste57867_22033 [Aphanomyces stellatus]|uniref:Aste57867_22033 protein n=1 Tax=Aphanomyces stellatus TaxID=120398 RepID=A0A485LJS8_9STRA|nr:hypothetical protein As57867_021964 [Aphanomyces stellatus]VFT98701.1 Aste57867_22033 [Aphanomyces stellatus]